MAKHTLFAYKEERLKKSFPILLEKKCFYFPFKHGHS